MHPSRRRKKRPNYGIRTVEVMRGPNGFGFTISGQQPCILSCIVNNSPAEQAGLRAGDFLISVNGVSVSKKAHDAVVSLIGNCVGPIKMTIAENYYSDSSDEDLECSRMGNSRKPKYMHKPRGRVNKVDLNKITIDMNENSLFKTGESVIKQDKNGSQSIFNESVPDQFLNIPNCISMDEEPGPPIEYKVLVGYLGTIEMPKQLLPNSRLQTVCSCIRKLRQEKRSPTAVLMTVLPTCLTLKNSCNNILAIYPSNRVVYVGSTTDHESRYFGLVTSAVSDARTESVEKCCGGKGWDSSDKRVNNVDNNIEISNSCHIFAIDPKIVDHNLHQKKAESFRMTCTSNMINGNCLEFPSSSLYIVSLIQNMYKLQSADKNNENAGPIIANSPQPSASSNSDSGIGFRDDCGNISDRILVVEFPIHRPLQTSHSNNRPSGIHASNVPLEYLDKQLNSDQLQHSFETNNRHRINNVSNSQLMKNHNSLILNNLNNVRACEHSVKQKLENGDTRNSHSGRYDNDQQDNICRLTCRAIPDFIMNINGDLSPPNFRSSENNPHIQGSGPVLYSERPVDVPFSDQQGEPRNGSVDNISIHSSRSNEFSNLLSVFKAPFESKKVRKNLKMSSLDNLDKCDENSMNYKMSPKVCPVPKINYSCGDFNNLDTIEKYGYGSLQDLWSFNGPQADMKSIAQSEPDVRISRDNENNLFDQNGFAKCISSEGPMAWSQSFEKLIEDPLGLHIFTEFLKKQFSAENIYFWTACERFRLLPAGAERRAEAARIHQRHLAAGAAEPVNVDAQGRQLAEQALREADERVFELAQKQIFVLMKLDCYPRFLKSDLYRRCVAGEIEKAPLDARLVLHQSLSTPSKLKKSVSNAEDRRRKSLLPWHRKNRSKSKDRGESEYSQKANVVASEYAENNNLADGVKGDLQSSGSSLTSLDLAISNQELDKPRHCSQEIVASNNDRIALCRVILSNGSTTVTQIRESETIQDLVNRILDKRGITYSSFEVFTNKHPKCMDVNESSKKLAGCEVTVEQRVVFKLDLPNRKTINIRSKYTKIIVDVLRPSLHKYQYNLDEVYVLNGNILIDLDVPVTTIDGFRLKVQMRQDLRNGSQHQQENCNNNSKVTKLDEITNKVFEGILQDKFDSAHKVTKSDKGSLKSEDWGSEHSSTFIGKFLRRDSGIIDRKKKMATKCKLNFVEDTVDDQNQLKKPLIAKMKPGANKLHLSDELVEGLTRAQRRIEDQRGTEINFELPDFLKDKENDELSNKTDQDTQSESNRQEPKKPTAAPTAKKTNPGIQYNYENRNVMVPPKYLTTQETEIIRGRMASPFKSAEESSSSSQSSPAKSGLNATVIENKKPSEPPPLPPKPKIVPIKPPNWGQVNNAYKAKEAPTSERSQGLFFERTSSSFV